MQLFGKYLQETEDRPAIFIRHNALPLLQQWHDSLNQGTHRCIFVKKNVSTFVFYIFLSSVTLELFANYDDERYCFKVINGNSLVSINDSSLNIDKINHIEGVYGLSVKPEGWKYRNSQAILTTSKTFDDINSLDSYDVVIEELRRQEEIRLRKEEEDKNAEKQLAVWTKYICKERELLDSANKPFALAESLPEIKKSHVNVETLKSIESKADTETLNQIVEIIGGTVSEDEIEMNLEEFQAWQKSDNLQIDAKILGQITMLFTVFCDGHWIAKEFKEENNYGRDLRYSWYDYENSSIDLAFKSSDPEQLYKLYDRANNSFLFHGNISPSNVKLTFSLLVKTSETDEERKKRIDILSGRELYSMPNMKGVLLGTLNKNGSDKKYLRIILPKEKEEKNAAKDFFEKNAGKSILIYPGLYKDKVLLNRQFDALNKLSDTSKLENKNLKDFIFNSSRAQATEDFIGLSTLSSTPQYIDCQSSQMLLLNPSQQEAVVKGLYAKDLCLLQGPPGTGKTTVISELIWQHIRANQQTRIMLTSQTNLAIDNALNRLFSNSALIVGSPIWRNIMLIKPIRKADSEKIEEEGLPFAKERIDDWVKGNDLSESSNNIVCQWMKHIAQRVEMKTPYAQVLSEWKSSLNNPSSDLRKLFADQYENDANVLCMTCGKVDSSDFKMYESGKGFDVVIVDEASKATLPELLMPLCYARKSIIIGDHRQLPPVIFEDDFFNKIREIDPELVEVLDKQFKHELVEESLFKRLITHPFLSPSIKATFNIQYRMHPDINAVISQFYASDSGGLSCGLDKEKVNLANFAEKNSRYHGLSFGKFIQPNVHTIWVDVPDGMEQGGEGSSSFNEKEVEAVSLVIEALSRANGFKQYMDYWRKCNNSEVRLTESKIGVISFYAAQVQKIKGAIQSFCDRNNIKVSTKSVDKFQGQESGIVIVSTVRTKRLGFTRTPERLNVALSRARRLLIIVGNSDFYSSEKAKTNDGQLIYRNVIERIKDNQSNGVFIDYHDLKNLLRESL